MPIDPTILPIFIFSVFLLMITPGPDMIFITANSLAGGWKAGLASVIGVTLGAYIHVLAAAAGVSAIIATSEIAYSVLRFGGAAYIAWIGYNFLVNNTELGNIKAAPPKPLFNIFKQGIITNVMNPKAALFTLSFVPQFVSAEMGPIWLQMLALGIIICFIMIIVELPIVFASSSFASKIKKNSESANLIGKIAGVLLILLSGFIALSPRHS